MAQPLPPKGNLETVDRIVDWSARLGDDAITASTFTLTAGTVTLSDEAFSDQQTALTITGGAVGETATIRNEITTEGGQTLVAELSIYIEASIGPYGPSTTTKGDIVELAYEELGSAGYQFDHGPDEKASTLRKLDLLMASTTMPQIGYNAPAGIGASDMLDASGLPDSGAQAVAIELGIRMMPAWGKTMSPETRRARIEGMNGLRALTPIPTMLLRAGTPIGTGNKWRSLWRPFTRRNDGKTVFVGP